MLEDDLFPQTQPRIHRVHANVTKDGTIHFDTGGGFFGVRGRKAIEHHQGKIWHFSQEEIRHLFLATSAFTLALGLMRVGGLFNTSEFTSLSQWVAILLLSMPVMLLAVGPAFILHEIGHKIVAKHYGCWAEFRADPKGLQFGVIISAFLGIVFMAPGAVMVAGMVTRRQNGHIAIAGPLVNLSLFLIGIPIGGLLLGLFSAETASNSAYLTGSGLNLKAMLFDVVEFWIFANLILGTFNMLPFGPLDGAKIIDWNQQIWFGTFAVFIGLIYLMFIGSAFSPLSLAISIAELI
jgi:Zn-dependent protease